MAKNYAEILALANKNNMGLSNTIKRDYGIPLDYSSVQETYEKALEYAKTSTLAYIGQPISVGDILYVVTTEENGYLKQVGTLPVGDDHSIEVVDGKIKIKGFGNGYYKYNAEVDGNYEFVESGFKAGLQPQIVAASSGEGFEIAWYEPNPTTVEGLQSEITALSGSVNTLTGRTSTLEGEMDDAEGRLDTLEAKAESWDGAAEKVSKIVVTEDSVTDGTTTFTKYDDTALAARVKSLEDNPYVLPEDVVQDSDYANRMSAVEAGIAGIDGKVEAGVADGLAEAKSYTDQEIATIDVTHTKKIESALEAEVTRADAKYELAGAEARAKAYIDEVKATILGDNEKLVDTYDTLSEIGNWIASHEGEGGVVVNLTTAIANEEQARKDADDAIIERVAELEKVDHDHSNKDVLDGTTASFTTELLNKLNGIEEGANKYELPSDVVKDSNYKHITVTENSVSDGVNTFEKYVLPSDVVADANYKHITVTDNSISDGTTTFNKYDDTVLSGRVSSVESDLLTKANTEDVVSNEVFNEYKEDVAEAISSSLDDAKSYVDEAVEDINDKLDKKVNIEGYVAYSAEEKAKLANLENYDDSELLERISDVEGYFTEGKANEAVKFGGQLPEYYASKESVEEAIAGVHEHNNKDVLDEITSEQVAAWDAAEQNAKTYSDGKLGTAVSTLESKITEEKSRAEGVESDFESRISTLEAKEPTKVEKSDTNGNIKVDGEEVKVYDDSDLVSRLEVVENKPFDTYAIKADVETALSGKVDNSTLDSYYTKGQTETKISEMISDINGGESAGEVLSQLNSYKTLNDERVAAIESKNIEQGLAIQSNTDAIAVLTGSGDGSVAKQISTAVAGIIAEAPEAYDTLKEIADYIASDKTGAAELSNKVSANTSGIEALLSSLESEVSRATAKETELAGLISSLDAAYKAKDAELVAEDVRLANLIKNNLDAIAKLNGDVNTDGSVDKKIAAAIAAIPSVPTATTEALGLVKVGNTMSVDSEGTINVAKVSTDILVQGTNELILNGGSSEVTAA